MSIKTCLLSQTANVIVIIKFYVVYNMMINTTHIRYNIQFVIILFVVFITISNTVSNMIANIQEVADSHGYDIKIFLYDNK